MPAVQNYTVTGMSCGHCESAVREEVGALEGVTVESVSASEGALRISVDDGAAVSEEAVVAAVDEAGYQAARAA
ncbi:cation transporter [Nesterenkonia halophila]|uniref:heavy-metal-associated domain-containing protein n=1 Tax=Nesterenkonia halophila TaxID=302044 RepID=UPI001291EF89|nr:cation transporter [Nesterenkonia halophila]